MSHNGASVKLRCLLAEDDDVCRALLSRLLRLRGVEVVEARDGLEAIDAVESNGDLDFILMDLQMPRLDGCKATHLLRERGHRLPIIAVTGATQLEGVNLMEQGFSGYFGKPIDFSELTEFLANNFGVALYG